MPWWGWIMLGAVLLGAELFVIPTRLERYRLSETAM